jgi:hypothetical protein
MRRRDRLRCLIGLLALLATWGWRPAPAGALAAPAAPPQPGPRASPAAPAPTRTARFAPTGPLLADIGFRPPTDGLQFANRPGEPDTLTIEDARFLFGDERVCVERTPDSGCIPDPRAERWVAEMNRTLSVGLCEGFATLSQLLFLGQIDAQALEPGAQVAADLRPNDREVIGRIGAYAATQFLEPVASTTAATRRLAPAQILDLLISQLQPGADPPTLGIYMAGAGGHTLLPFAVEERGRGLFRVWVYDTNWPGSAKYLEIDRGQNTWRYAMGALSPRHDPSPWLGDSTTFSMDLTPASLRRGPFRCPFCDL